MNRGDHLEAIFKDETDRKMWLRTLGETCSSAGWGKQLLGHWLRRRTAVGVK
ncbi:MAG: hypothetical protein PHV34_07165 [Verrucomicrobiae bacterium]|nr:hypothetical protein [Verrucomicrobiae bacterium]